MAIKVIHATGSNIDTIVSTMRGELRAAEPKLLIYFASSQLDAPALARAVHGAFPGTLNLGCTTSGELISGKMLKNSVTAMLLDSEHLADAHVEMAGNIAAPGAVRQALDAFEKHYGEPVSAMSPEHYVGLVLTDGLSIGEEHVNADLASATNVRFVGGSAGDDLAFKQTYVFANGEAQSGASALALLKPRVPFTVLKTQSFKSLGKKLKATKVDESTRTIYEFNGRPAAVAYAEALGVTVETLPTRFMRNPLGLMVSPTDPFVRSPQRLAGEAVVFYCQVSEGMELELLEGGDIVGDTAQALAHMRQKLGSVSGLINFNCILRTLDLEERGQTEAYGRLFEAEPMIGFSTYGESYIGHINQTATMVFFGNGAATP